MSDSEESDEFFDIDWEQADSVVFDYLDSFSLSPQALAVIENDVERLKQLLVSGKSVNINDNKGNTPLHLAVLKDKRQVFDYLMTVEEVRIDAVNFEGSTPLVLALICANEYFALQLIKKGADVNLANNMDDAPLHYAASNCSCEVGQALIEKGAEVDVRNSAGETPLFLACSRNNCDVIHMLLYYGADVNVISYGGHSPFSRVLRNCSPDLEEIFFNYTFDQEKISVNIHVLIEAMKTGSTLFYRILEKTSHVVFDEDDLKVLNQCLPSIDSHLFKTFIEKFEDVAEDLFSFCDCLTDYVTCIGESFEENNLSFIDVFYVLFESAHVSLIVEKYQPKVYLLHSICRKNIPEKALTELICCMLSYGVDIISDDLNTVFKRYGFCELFKIMLHMDIVDCPLRGSDANFETFLFPALIYDVTLDIDECLREPQKYIFRSNAMKLFKFFADPKLQEYCLRSFFDKIDNLPSVPSLLELARNSARKYVIEKYRVRKSVHFFTVLRWMPISEVYKTILSYEKELYNV